MKNAIYFAVHENALANGSYYRADGPTSPEAAHYMNGDYMGIETIEAMPTGLKQFTRDEAKRLLPKCCK